MAAEYPGAVPNFSGMVGGTTDPLSSPSLPTYAQKAADEIAAIATELGVTPSAGWATVVARLASCYVPMFKSGLYYTSPFQGQGQAATTEAELNLIPFVANGLVTFDRIGVEVITTAGSTGAVIRLGRYAADASGYPAALVADDGTVDATTTGGKELTISWTPAAGLWYLASVTQGGATTKPTVRIVQNTVLPVVGNLTLIGAPATAGYRQNAVTGALPDPFTSTATPAPLAPMIRLRVA